MFEPYLRTKKLRLNEKQGLKQLVRWWRRRKVPKGSAERYISQCSKGDTALNEKGYEYKTYKKKIKNTAWNWRKRVREWRRKDQLLKLYPLFVLNISNIWDMPLKIYHRQNSCYGLHINNQKHHFYYYCYYRKNSWGSAAAQLS